MPNRLATASLFFLLLVPAVPPTHSRAEETISELLRTTDTSAPTLISATQNETPTPPPPIESVPVQTLDANLSLPSDLPFLSSGASLARLDAGRSATSPMTRLANDFTGFPEFDSGVVVQGDRVALKIGGYVKADLIKDFDAIDSTDSFVTTDILTDGEDRENARFHARQSRLSFDTRWLVDQRVVRAFIEADFFGSGADGSSNFRLRHAYGAVGNLTVGQTWTTFTDVAAVPQTLDFEGAVSAVNRRHGLIRWQQPILFEGLSLALALENPEIIIEKPTGAPGEGRTQSPDFISRVRIERDWGAFQVAYLLRRLGFQRPGQDVITDNAQGLNFTGAFLLTRKTKAYYQITWGDGIGSYRGSPDLVATGPDSGAILPMFGWMVGLKREWSDRLTSNVTYSELSIDNIAGQKADDLANTQYLAVNLISNPLERFFCGIELLHGVRDDFGGASGSANRLQMSFGFFLP